MLTFLYLLLIGNPWFALAAVNFDDFNLCPQIVLKQFVPENCDFGTATQTDVIDDWMCLCTSDSFLDQTAPNIWESCGCADLEATANTISEYCTDVGYPISGVESYISYGDGNVFPCVNPSTGGSKLSAGDIVGIVAGALAFVALIVGLVQMAAAIGWISPKYKPWPQIVKLLCCGTIRVQDQKTERTEREEREETEKKKKEKALLETQRVGDMERGALPEYNGGM
jgi:hypothetical protein